MHSFTDTAGRTWNVVINVDAIRRVRDRLGVNLLEAIDGNLLERLVGDPVLLCDVLFVLVEPIAESKQVSDEAFGRSLGGDVLEEATNALLEELADFFPSGRRALFRKALDKLATLETKALQLANERLDSGELEREMEAALRSTSGSSSGNSLESPRWIPDC